jgi:hypothetical protein
VKNKMAKEIKAQLKLNLAAGEATPAPPVGPALGQHGVPIMEFIKDAVASGRQITNTYIMQAGTFGVRTFNEYKRKDSDVKRLLRQCCGTTATRDRIISATEYLDSRGKRATRKQIADMLGISRASLSYHESAKCGILRTAVENILPISAEQTLIGALNCIVLKNQCPTDNNLAKQSGIRLRTVRNIVKRNKQLREKMQKALKDWENENHPNDTFAI